jgi:hypothetical protein
MTTFQFQYPGDPILSARWMTGLEFTQEQPDRFISVRTDAGTTLYPVDVVLCDSCNVEIRPDDRCCLAHDWLYCVACAARMIVPYTVKGTHAQTTTES